MVEIRIEADFPVKDVECKYYCCPTCHPAQVNKNYIYTCRHPSWPVNKAGDFPPVVTCEGKYVQCELSKTCLTLQRRGLKVRITNATAKILKWEADIDEINLFLECIKEQDNENNN